MFATMSDTLSRLGVPFFGTKIELILKDENETANDPKDSAVQSDIANVQRISKKELVKLQRQMIQYLEDMYKP